MRPERNNAFEALGATSDPPVNIQERNSYDLVTMHEAIGSVSIFREPGGRLSARCLFFLSVRGGVYTRSLSLVRTVEGAWPVLWFLCGTSLPRSSLR